MERKREEAVRRHSAYPKTPRTIYHAQRAQQEVRLGMLMWAAGAGSQCACATPRGANHRPRNGSCARSQLVGHHNLGKMEEESFRVERDLPFPSVRSILVLHRFVSPLSSFPSPRRSRRHPRGRVFSRGEIHVSLPCPTFSSHANEHDSKKQNF